MVPFGAAMFALVLVWIELVGGWLCRRWSRRRRPRGTRRGRGAVRGCRGERAWEWGCGWEVDDGVHPVAQVQAGYLAINGVVRCAW